MTDDLSEPAPTLEARLEAVKMRYWLLLGFLVPFSIGFLSSSGEPSERVGAGLALGFPFALVSMVALPVVLMGLVLTVRALVRDIPSGEWRKWKPLNVALAVGCFVVLPVTLVLTFGLPDRSIGYEEAGDHIGEEHKVCGPVVDVESTMTDDGDDLTFVNVGEPYPDRDGFTFAVNGSPFKESDLPDDYVCAEGELRRFEGRPQMFVASTSDLRFPGIEGEEDNCYDFRVCY